MILDKDAHQAHLDVTTSCPHTFDHTVYDNCNTTKDCNVTFERCHERAQGVNRTFPISQASQHFDQNIGLSKRTVHYST